MLFPYLATSIIFVMHMPKVSTDDERYFSTLSNDVFWGGTALLLRQVCWFQMVSSLPLPFGDHRGNGLFAVFVRMAATGRHANLYDALLRLKPFTEIYESDAEVCIVQSISLYNTYICTYICCFMYYLTDTWLDGSFSTPNIAC